MVESKHRLAAGVMSGFNRQVNSSEVERLIHSIGVADYSLPITEWRFRMK
jgi:hypothetical protein